MNGPILKQKLSISRTPAIIEAIYLRLRILRDDQSIEECPDYSDAQCYDKSDAVLGPNGDGIVHIISQRIVMGHRPKIMEGKMKVWAYGFVDYSDRLGKKHRSGYGRRYSHMVDTKPQGLSEEKFAKRNNLLFMNEQGYNYDRERKKSCPEDSAGML